VGMIEILRPKGLNKRAVALFVVIIVTIAALPILSGCGGNSPQAAVERYFKAWEESDWEEYKDSLVVDGSKPTGANEDLARQEFEQVRVRAEDLKTQTSYDQKDENVAFVTLVKGKITLTTDLLGEEKTRTLDLAEMNREDRPTITVKRIRGTWYVEMVPELLVSM